jgi:hypothetical protein
MRNLNSRINQLGKNKWVSKPITSEVAEIGNSMKFWP